MLVAISTPVNITISIRFLDAQPDWSILIDFGRLCMVFQNIGHELFSPASKARKAERL
jgi:hypothetical protein